jgi:8-oxo-dGTP pyrophosphatase MutT (NUDIX family)
MLPDTYKAELECCRQSIRAVDLDQEELSRLEATWQPRLKPAGRDFDEQFEVSLPDGTTTGVAGPRWLFHLLGIPHRACYVGLCTPAGLLLLQRRAACKTDYPDLWDLTVSGHVARGVGEQGEATYYRSALREIVEELGLSKMLERGGRWDGRAGPQAVAFLTDGLVAIGPPGQFPPAPSPHWWQCDVEVRQLFTGTLTAEALASIELQSDEVAGLYLCRLSETMKLYREETLYRTETGSYSRILAPGAYWALPALLEWLGSPLSYKMNPE